MKKNSQATVLRRQVGFTLIEILAVMIVFGLIGGIAAGILVTTLRTSNKTSIITTVKQNGDFAISQIVKNIRNSYVLRSPATPCGTPQNPTEATSMTLLDGSGTVTTIACTGANPIPPTPADTITIQTGGGQATSLFDTSMVKTYDCSFTCSQSSQSDYPVIGVNFSLLQKSSSTFSEQIASASAIRFSTSVIFRNFQR